MITVRGLGDLGHRSCASSLHADLFNSYGVGAHRSLGGVISHLYSLLVCYLSVDVTDGSW
jgi:hypothetical protein